MGFVSVRMIQRAVADHFGVKLSDLQGHERYRFVAEPRAIAMYLARKLTGLSYEHLGRGFGGKDHTTVMNAVQKVTKRAASDQQLRGKLEELEALLDSRTTAPEAPSLEEMQLRCRNLKTENADLVTQAARLKERYLRTERERSSMFLQLRKASTALRQIASGCPEPHKVAWAALPKTTGVPASEGASATRWVHYKQEGKSWVALSCVASGLSSDGYAEENAEACITELDSCCPCKREHEAP